MKFPAEAIDVRCSNFVSDSNSGMAAPSYSGFMNSRRPLTAALQTVFRLPNSDLKHESPEDVLHFKKLSAARGIKLALTISICFWMGVIYLVVA